MDAIEFRALAYRYPDAGRAALRDVELVLSDGLTLLTGDSGSGKSTLLRVCNGLVPHFHGGAISGVARVFGQDVTRTTTRRLARDVGFVFQDPELQAVYVRVEHDVAFGLENMQIPRPQMRERVEAALAACGILALRNRNVSTLSGGERQRVALAGVLAMRPRMLVLDEPLSQLDSDGACAVMSAVEAAVSRQTVTLVAEHRHRLVQPLTTRIIGMAGGVLVRHTAEGAPDGLSLLQADVDADGAESSGAAAPSAGATGGAGLRLSDVVAGHNGSAVLQDVDLSVASGEIVAVTGRNGSGKTTLLRTIAGLLPPLHGHVERADGRVAYLPQNPTALLHRQTLRDEVAWTLRHDGAGPSVDAVLRSFALTHVADRYPRDLSTGERQRAALAAALAGAPVIALLDEPTRGMDSAARTVLARVTQRLAHAGAAVVIATHDDEVANLVATRIVETCDGRVVERRRSPHAPMSAPAPA